jgi:hypothetical protein
MKSPPLSQLIDHFQTLRDLKHSAKKSRVPIQKPEKQRKFFRSKYPNDLKKLLIRVYYGYDDSYAKPAFSMYRMSKLFRMPLCTVSFILKKFNQAGKSFTAFDPVVKAKYKMISPDVQAQLLDPDLL